jgi:hypothetical protein
VDGLACSLRVGRGRRIDEDVAAVMRNGDAAALVILDLEQPVVDRLYLVAGADVDPEVVDGASLAAPGRPRRRQVRLSDRAPPRQRSSE